MITKNSYRLLVLTLIGILVYSCQKDGFADPSSEINLLEPQAQHEQVEPPESWATGVEHTITNRVYPATIVGTRNFPYSNNLQHITLSYLHNKKENDGYTPIAIEAIL
jgi:sorbitol-specific phosphotransferase system component IIA